MAALCHVASMQRHEGESTVPSWKMPVAIPCCVDVTIKADQITRQQFCGTLPARGFAAPLSVTKRSGVNDLCAR